MSEIIFDCLNTGKNNRKISDYHQSCLENRKKGRPLGWWDIWGLESCSVGTVLAERVHSPGLSQHHIDCALWCKPEKLNVIPVAKHSEFKARL